MIVPHLHFCGNCEEAIATYEKAFNTKVEDIVINSDYSPNECKGDNRIAHAAMKIHGQTVFLNDNEAMFSVQDISLNFPIHIIVYFQTSYSELVGNFKDKFGMLWGFMIA